MYDVTNQAGLVESGVIDVSDVCLLELCDIISFAYHKTSNTSPRLLLNIGLGPY